MEDTKSYLSSFVYIVLTFFPHISCILSIFARQPVGIQWTCSTVSSQFVHSGYAGESTCPNLCQCCLKHPWPDRNCAGWKFKEPQALYHFNIYDFPMMRLVCHILISCSTFRLTASVLGHTRTPYCIMDGHRNCTFVGVSHVTTEALTIIDHDTQLL